MRGVLAAATCGRVYPRSPLSPFSPLLGVNPRPSFSPAHEVVGGLCTLTRARDQALAAFIGRGHAQDMELVGGNGTEDRPWWASV